ncbi:MICOS complex subunit MIC10 isoform X1 [Elaeis guineensis]|uniref:MICOS complex subunit MIC10 isoform X1 n=1 Tax=Elaeis guineensis var. tenera TaxID=51953 RepID=UPI003C6D018A
MAEEKKHNVIPPRYDLDAKWDACLDLTIRRFFYSSLAGAFTGLLLFRSPTTRWASVAFGAGVGIGAAYTESSYIFDGSPPKLSPNVSAGPSGSAQVSYFFVLVLSKCLI